MSSTIERRGRAVARTLALAGFIAAGWVGANAAILAATERAEAVLVMFSRSPEAVRLPESVAILEWDGHFARFVGRREGYVADLYRAGALAVLPARGGGCLRMVRQTGGQPGVAKG
ncbi:hypothetical protein [Aureimonas phyllosphaerae]|uniref:Uncharacterized protein n=1 Tax=Aureimonas phyllosphaerae TaxID=1166078 RepID=A0A7W6BXQ2_9HYPH|nr:hypothetical protein [Aureimonas phyllosphaerae]MBB3937063.1 hypothetical protein [Aureimonas phyllosphaerae]MBB3960822.1 hypothetical protein [Aureimonas phyllosphaerae]